MYQNDLQLMTLLTPSVCWDNQSALPWPRRTLCLSFTHKSCLYIREVRLSKVTLPPDS